MTDLSALQGAIAQADPAKAAALAQVFEGLTDIVGAILGTTSARPGPRTRVDLVLEDIAHELADVPPELQEAAEVALTKLCGEIATAAEDRHRLPNGEWLPEGVRLDKSGFIRWDLPGMQAPGATAADAPPLPADVTIDLLPDQFGRTREMRFDNGAVVVVKRDDVGRAKAAHATTAGGRSFDVLIERDDLGRVRKFKVKA